MPFFLLLWYEMPTQTGETKSYTEKPASHWPPSACKNQYGPNPSLF